jgi:hypothetical protein
MKIWYGHGSEHSMNLVMIGHFKDADNAAKAKQVIDELMEQVLADTEAGLMVIGENTERFSEKMLELLGQVHIHDVGPDELEQFGYDFRVEVDESKVIVTTDESDVSAFLKVLINKGARVEVYSAHYHPDTEYGRGK